MFCSTTKKEDITYNNDNNKGSNKEEDMKHIKFLDSFWYSSVRICYEIIRMKSKLKPNKALLDINNHKEIFYCKINFRQVRLMLNDDICRGSCRWISLQCVMILDTSAFIAICFCSEKFLTQNLILKLFSSILIYIIHFHCSTKTWYPKIKK